MNSRCSNLCAAVAAALSLGACVNTAALEGGLATGRQGLRLVAEKRLEISIFSLCGTPYSTLVRRSAENQALARAAKELCGAL